METRRAENPGLNLSPVGLNRSSFLLSSCRRAPRCAYTALPPFPPTSPAKIPPGLLANFWGRDRLLGNRCQLHRPAPPEVPVSLKSRTEDDKAGDIAVRAAVLYHRQQGQF